MEEARPAIDSGDTAWMIVATALVLLMTIPGLALLYTGMVRVKNALSVLMQCLAIASLVSVLWVAYGYSLAFDTTGMSESEIGLRSFIGGLGKAFMAGVTIGGQVWVQVKSVLFTIAWSGVGSFIILKLLDATMGLRVSKEQEVEGLDLALHDERACNN